MMKISIRSTATWSADAAFMYYYRILEEDSGVKRNDRAKSFVFNRRICLLPFPWEEVGIIGKLDDLVRKRAFENGGRHLLSAA